MREQHAVNAELKSSGLLSAYGRMQTGRFGLLSIGRANVATRAGAEWPGLVVTGPTAFGEESSIAAKEWRCCPLYPLQIEPHFAR